MGRLGTSALFLLGKHEKGCTLPVSDFVRALSLSERLEASPRPCDPGEAARARLAKWKSQPGFARFGQWHVRLTDGALDEAQLLALIDEDDASLLARVPRPAWLTRLTETFARETGPSPSVVRGIEGTADRTQRACLRLAAPLIGPCLAEVEAVVSSAAIRLGCDPQWLTGALFAQLADCLEMPLLRSLSLAVNEARLRGELTGATPEDRFDDFIAQKVAVPGSFFRACPVLVRHLDAIIGSWSSSSRTFLRELTADFPAIRARFWRDLDPGPLVGLEGGAGDVHRGGRSVLMLRFQSGARLVYKPHSLGVDVHVNDLIRFINREGGPEILDLRTIATLDLGDHGYAEFVPTLPCATRQHLARYYRRQGQQLALMYALDGIDIHSDNVLAHGEYPVIVDLEALFHPRVEHKLHVDPAARAILQSVQRIFFLPRRMESADDRVGFDVSGLGDRPGQIMAKPTPLMRASATDTMHVERSPLPLPPNPNRPTVAGAEVDVMEFVEEVCAGFNAMARLLLGKRADLLAPGGAVDAFRQDEVRVILRNTSYYDNMLRASYHPPYLRDGLDRDRLFDRLYHEVAFQPSLRAVVTSEREDLCQGDIPVFTTTANSTTLRDGRGRTIDGVIEKSGYQGAVERLTNLDEADIARQEWLIRASFATIPLGKGERHWRGSALAPTSRRISVDERIARAAHVGDRLVTLAHRSGPLANWLGLALFGEVEWRLSPTDLNLYDGLLGIALFLAYLTRITGSDAYRGTIDGALAAFRTHMRLREEFGEEGRLGIGGVAGSAAYTLSHLALVLDRPALLDEAERTLGAIEAKAQAPDARTDVMGGLAGALLGVLSLHRARGSAETLRIAKLCGERLVAAAIPQSQGVGWKPNVAASAPLTGFSHGASGVAVALARLASATDGDHRARFAETARQALRYESTAFAGNNWYDFRIFEGLDPKVLRSRWMWCHGAPGVGLARAAMLDLAISPEDDLWRADLAVAAKSTAEFGFGLNHSLCHGDLGNIEVLREAARLLGDSSLAQAYESRLAQIAESIDRIGWSCGVPLGVENPGLFTGIAGIGYAWLRAAAPDHVPSVLLLSPPVP